MKARRKLWLIVLPLVCVIAGAYGAWKVWDRSARSRFVAAVELYRSAGFPLRAVDLRPENLHPDDNAAALYIEASALAQELPRGFDFEEFLTHADSASNSESKANAEALFAAASPAFELLRRAAEHSHCVFARDYQFPFDGESLYLSGLIQLVRMFCAGAIHQMESGDETAALEDLHAVFHLSRLLRTDPELMTQIQRIAVTGLGIDALRIVLPRCQNPRAALARVELDDVSGAVFFGARADAARTMEAAIVDAGLMGYEPSEHLRFEEGLETFYWIARLRWLTEPYISGEKALIVDFRRQVLEALQQPYDEALLALDRAERDLKERGGVFAQALFFRINNLVTREAIAVARAAQTFVVAEVLHFRRETGAWPQSFKELVAAGAPELKELAPEDFEFALVGEGLEVRRVDGKGTPWLLESHP